MSRLCLGASETARTRWALSTAIGSHRGVFICGMPADDVAATAHSLGSTTLGIRFSLRRSPFVPVKA